MPLDIKVTHDNAVPSVGRVRVALDGSLDTATSSDLEKTLGPLLAGNVRVLVLDLQSLRFLSSAGIRVLMSTRKDLVDRGGSFVLTNLQPQIAKVLEIVKALPGVSIFRNDAEMDAYLIAMQRKVIQGDQEEQ